MHLHVMHAIDHNATTLIFILNLTRGSPMAISLIGAMLRRNSDLERWEAIADRMEKKHFHLDTKIKNWGYEHPTLNASIELRSVYNSSLPICVVPTSCILYSAKNSWDIDF